MIKSIKAGIALTMLTTVVFSGVYIETVNLPAPVLEHGCLTIEGSDQEFLPGYPDIPIHTVAVPIDIHESVNTVTVGHTDYVEEKLSSKISTIQQPFTDGYYPGVQLPEYDLTEFTPQNPFKIYSSGVSGDKHSVYVTFYPASYNHSLDTVRYATNFSVLVRTVVNRASTRTVSNVLWPDTCRYIIISSTNLYNYTGEYSIHSLLEHRSNQGFTTKFVATEWIYANFDGRDEQEKIRHFCQEAYTMWGLEFLLLVGDRHTVPLRNFHDGVEGAPSDYLYYGCLDGDMDYNQNNVFGEFGDGVDGVRRIDYLAEVAVGRLPVSDIIELNNVIRKTIMRDSNTYLTNHAFAAEKLSEYYYPYVYMESHLINPRKFFDVDLVGYRGSMYSNDFSQLHKMYDMPGEPQYTNDDVIDMFNGDMAIINHAGHGGVNACFRMLGKPDNFDRMTNSVTPIVFSIACSTGKLDHESIRSFAEVMICSSNAASIACMNTRNGWYFVSAPLYSLYQHVCFIDSILKGALYVGDAFKYMQDMASIKAKYSGDITCYDKAVHAMMLFGDPAAPLFPSEYKKPVEIRDVVFEEDSTVLEVTCVCMPAGFYNGDSVLLIVSNDNVRVTHHMIGSGNMFYTAIPKSGLKLSQPYTITVTGVNGLVTTLDGCVELTTPPPSLVNDTRRDVIITIVIGLLIACFIFMLTGFNKVS